MQLAALVGASEDVRATSARNRKIARLAEVLEGAGARDLQLAVAYLAGTLPQGRIGLGWASVGDADVPAASQPSITLAEVDAMATAVADEAGSGSQQRRSDLLTDLLRRATAKEQAFLRGLLLGELRQGAKEGVVLEAVARATNVAPARLRRAVMLLGDLPAAAGVAAADGEPGLASIGLQVGRPVRPMLASSAPDVETALAAAGDVTVDAKLDGMRVQVHREGSEVLVVTRSLRDVTSGMPGVVEVARSLGADRFVLDGEALAVHDDGRPAPFQESMSGPSDGDRGLRPFFFDCLHLDGQDLLDAPLAERLTALDRIVPEAHRVQRIDQPTADGANEFADAVLAAGHEGVVVKSRAATYQAGRRGKAWVKVKPAITLDLVVLAVEWGSGRRQGWLSNIHLGARDGDDFVMLGKTFKGMTDEMLAWQTERFLDLEVRRTKHVVHVRPEQVVEIAIDGVQASTRYPGGVALRFARVKRYRDDKTPDEADTLATVRALLP